MSAILHGIGLGPGDPELITVKGLRLLRQASCVFLPATRPGHSYAREVAGCYLDQPRQEVLELVCPPLRDRQALELRWAELAGVVATKLRGNGIGAFLTEGDPSLYSTFQYLAEPLRRDHPEIEVNAVPGVTSASAAAALAGLPLAIWNERFAILPAIHESQELTQFLSQVDSAALLKVGGALPAVLDAVEALGADAEAVLIRRAGRAEQRIERDRAAIRAAPADYFSLLLVRKRRAR